MKKVMSRRSAFKATAATITTGAAVFQLGDFTSYGAVERKGNVNHSVCRWCYNKIPLDIFAMPKEMGINSIDLPGPNEWPTIQKYGLTCAMVRRRARHSRRLNRVANHEIF